MSLISKEYIKKFSTPLNMSAFENAFYNINQYLLNSLSNISMRNININNYEICIANECFTGAEHYGTSLDIFIIFDAVQIELNYENNNSFKFGTKFKKFWKNFISNFKIINTKKSKQKSFEKETLNKISDLQNYDVKSLYLDIINELSKLLYNKTTLQICKNCIKIQGEEEFGVEINIYPIFITDENSYKIYNLDAHKTSIINFANRFKNYEDKLKLTKNEYLTQLRIFNNLYRNIMKSSPNQVYIESLLYNSPNELFNDNVEQCTINLINYIKNSSISFIPSICNNEINVYQDNLCNIDIQTSLRFIKNL